MRNHSLRKVRTFLGSKVQLVRTCKRKQIAKPLWRFYQENTKIISKDIQDIQDKFKIPRPARPGPSPAQARGRAVPGRPVRGPGLGPGFGRAGPAAWYRCPGPRTCRHGTARHQAWAGLGPGLLPGFDLLKQANRFV